jgi:hypothetical protein
MLEGAATLFSSSLSAGATEMALGTNVGGDKTVSETKSRVH